MDHFYQQKLINEKNNLQRQLAVAQKQLAELTSVAQQYEQLFEELKGKQRKIDANHNGEIDAGDFAILRKHKKKKHHMQESAVKEKVEEKKVNGVTIPDKIRLRGEDTKKPLKEDLQLIEEELVQLEEELLNEIITQDQARKPSQGLETVVNPTTGKSTVQPVGGTDPTKWSKVDSERPGKIGRAHV